MTLFKLKRASSILFVLRERVNPANEETSILWSGVCPLLNWFYWGERWEMEKGLSKGTNF